MLTQRRSSSRNMTDLNLPSTCTVATSNYHALLSSLKKPPPLRAVFGAKQSYETTAKPSVWLERLAAICPPLGGQRRGKGTFCQHTESQNHRIVGVGRALCGSSSPTLLPKQGHPEQAAQDLVQAGLEYLQRRRLHSLPGQPVPGLRHPQRGEVLPHVQVELPLLQFVPIAPCPVAGHHCKEFGPILLTPTLQIFMANQRFQLHYAFDIVPLR